MQSVFSTRKNRILITITLAICSVAVASDPNTTAFRKIPVHVRSHSLKAPMSGQNTNSNRLKNF